MKRLQLVPAKKVFLHFNTPETLVSNEPDNTNLDDTNLALHLLDQFMILGNLTRLLITGRVREGTINNKTDRVFLIPISIVT